MNYSEQQAYLRSNRLVGLSASILLVLCSVGILLTFTESGVLSKLIFGALCLALIYILNYNPKYLHLNGPYQKRFFWAVRIRWIVCGVVLFLGLISARSKLDAVVTFSAVIWLAVAAYVARNWVKQPKTDLTFLLPAWYAATDFAILLILVFLGINPMLVAVTGAITAHFSLSISDGDKRILTVVAIFVVALLGLLGWVQRVDPYSLALFTSFLAISCYSTYRLTCLAHEMNERNISEATQELQEFAGLSKEEVRDLLLSSDRILAESWVRAKLDETDKQAVKRWYEENSFHYIFGLTSFHFAYKQIVLMLDILRLARGRCLDYGAGIGDLTLGLAQAGHPASYFDVDGKSREYAQWRAERKRLQVHFTTLKEKLTEYAQASGKFDTIIAIDVLEHVPDI